MARLGGNVTAVDAAEENIKMASFHASLDPTLNPIEFRAIPAGIKMCNKFIILEQLVVEERVFDVVCALEIIEHVSDKQLFVESLIKLTKVELSTIFLFIISLVESYSFQQ